MKCKIPYKRRNGKFILTEYDNSGSKVGQEFEFITACHENLFTGISYGDWVIIKESSEIVFTKDKFLYIDSFQNALAVGKLNIKSCNSNVLINTDGFTISTGYYNIEWVTKNFIKATRGTKYELSIHSDDYEESFEPCEFEYSILNKYGNIVLENASEDVAICSNYILNKKGSNYQLISNVGRLICETGKYIKITRFDRNRALAISHSSKFPLILNKKFEVICELKEFSKDIVELKSFCKGIYEDGFVNGLLPVTREGYWGLINNKGKLVIECIYDEIEYLGNGFFTVSSIRDNIVYKSFVNSKGKIKFPFVYNIVEPLSNKLIAISENEKWGVVDILNHRIIELKYDRLEFLSPNFLLGMKCKNKGEFGETYSYTVFNTRGEKLSNSTFDFVWKLNKQLVSVNIKGKSGVMDLEGRMITDMKFDHVSLANDYSILAEINNERFYLNLNGVEFKQ